MGTKNLLKVTCQNFFFVIALFLLSTSILARSGCCSHHGGVCGCGCCDGTGLSATCAPYYPSCNAPATKPIYTAPTIPKCPTNAVYDYVEDSCICKSGYCVSTNKDSCIFLPANAHCVSSTTDAWQCDSGYEELDSKCLVLKVETNETQNFPNTPAIPVTTNVKPANNPEPKINEEKDPDNSWLGGLLTIGGILLGKKYLVKKDIR